MTVKCKKKGGPMETQKTWTIFDLDLNLIEEVGTNFLT